MWEALSLWQSAREKRGQTNKQTNKRPRRGGVRDEMERLHRPTHNEGRTERDVGTRGQTGNGGDTHMREEFNHSKTTLPWG